MAEWVHRTFTQETGVTCHVKPSVFFVYLFKKKMFFHFSVAVWLNLGSKTNWLGLEKYDGLGSNIHFDNIKQNLFVQLRMF